MSRGRGPSADSSLYFGGKTVLDIIPEEKGGVSLKESEAFLWRGGLRI